MGRPQDCNCFCRQIPPVGCECPELGDWNAYQALNDKERILVIQICNSNAARDDNMEIILNGVTIDEVLDHNSNTKTGAIYVSDTGTTIDDNDKILVCPGENHEQITFDPDILLPYPSVNSLTAKLVQENNNGNFGDLVIASFPYPYVKNQGCYIVRDFWRAANTWNYEFVLCQN